MFFIVNKAKLQSMINIVREDKTPQSQAMGGPFLRIEARDQELTISSKEASAGFTLRFMSLGFYLSGQPISGEF